MIKKRILICALTVAMSILVAACSVHDPEVKETTNRAEFVLSDGDFYWTENEIQGLSDRGKTKTSIMIPKECVSIVGMFADGDDVVQIVTFESDASVQIAGAFASAVALQAVELPKNQEAIGGRAFANSSIVTIEIPNSVTSIGREAFYGCYTLRNVTIGTGVTEVGKDAFSGCTRLSYITVTEGSWADLHFEEFAPNMGKAYKTE